MAKAGSYNKIRRFVKQVGRDMGWTMGLGKKRFQASCGSRILVYHGICKTDPFQFNTLFISLKTFEKQLQFYKKNFHIISLDDFFAQKWSKDKFSICLTFDDGFANNYKYVLPLLEEYQVPASFFVTAIKQEGYDFLWNDILSIAGKYGPSKLEFRNETYVRDPYGKYVSKTSHAGLITVLKQSGFFPEKAELIQILEKSFSFKNMINEDYWKQMSIEQIKQLSASKWVTIGSHGYYHNDLAHISAPELEKDLRGSKEYLENITGKEISSLAFPYGSYSDKVLLEAKKAGYNKLLATTFLHHSDHKDAMLRERLTVNPFISTINQMNANISGSYD